MKLTGAEIANSEGTKFAQDVTCPWCLSADRLALGPQHVHGDLTMHCRKCGKFSRHKTADRWFDQHQERMEELKEVWKKIPPEAFITCRQATRGTPFVYTVYLGGEKRPEEFMSRDIIEHILTNEYGMSYKQAAGALASAILTPGQKIFLQRHTRLVMAAEKRELMKRTGGKEKLIATGTKVTVNGQPGMFLRYSSNDGFAVVAFPAGPEAFGDAEVPVMDLEVVDAGGPEVAEDFEFDKEMDNEGIEEGVGGSGLEEALEHIEVAEEIVEDLVLEESGSTPEADGFEGEHGIEKDDDEEDDEDESDEGEKEKPPFAASRRMALTPGAPRPGMDPRIDEKLRTLQTLIQDPRTDPQTLQEAQRQWTQLKRQVRARRLAWDEGDWDRQDCPECGQYDKHSKDCSKLKKKHATYKTKDDLAAMERPDHKTIGPKLTDTKFEGDSWVPRNEKKNPNPKEDKNLEKKANREAQRRVHTHYSHSGDLKRAIDVNRNDLSIEDIRDIVKFYANTGKIAHYEADELAFWFIGDKPRLLCASDLTAGKKCPDCDQEVNKHGECACEESWGPRGRDRDREDFHSDGSRRNAGPRYEEWLRNKQKGTGTSACTCRGAYDQYCPEHGAQESKRGTLSVHDLRITAKDAGECEVKDSHPESGASSGSGATGNPDPKKQAPPSANSVTGPEKVKEHGAGDSPKDAGDVEAPDLGVPKGASFIFTADEEEDDDGGDCSQCGGPLVPLGSLGKRKHYRCRNCGMDSSKEGMRKRADGICQKCGTPLNQAGQCPTCNSGAEQAQAQGMGGPATALSKGDLRRKGARHKDGCGCGFCSRMKENSDWSKGRGKEKAALAASDIMTKVAHDEVGIFMPALHNGKQVLVIAVDNTSLRATVQDGGGNQRQVDFSDLEPVKTGPYSGMPKKPDPGAR